MEDKLATLREELDGAQVQISDLTTKNVALEAIKDDLMRKMEELTTQRDHISAELEQVKESQKGI